MALSDAQRNAARKKQGLKPITKNSSSKKKQQEKKSSGTTQALTQTNSGKTAEDYRRLREDNINTIVSRRQPSRHTEPVAPQRTAEQQERNREAIRQSEIAKQNTPYSSGGRFVNGVSYGAKREQVGGNASNLRRNTAARSQEDDRLMLLAREQAEALYARTNDDHYRNDVARQNVLDMQTELQHTLTTLHDRYGYDVGAMQRSLDSMVLVNQTKNELSANARQIVNANGIKTQGGGDQDAYDTVIRYFGYDSKYRDIDIADRPAVLDDLFNQYQTVRQNGGDTYKIAEEIEWLANYGQGAGTAVSAKAREMVQQIRQDQDADLSERIGRLRGNALSGEYGVDIDIEKELERGNIFNREQQQIYGEGAGFDNQVEPHPVLQELQDLEHQRALLRYDIDQYRRTTEKADKYAPLELNADYRENLSREGFVNASRQEMDAYDQAKGGNEFVQNDLIGEGADTPQAVSAPVVQDKLGLFLNTTAEERDEAYHLGDLGNGNTWGTYVAEGVEGSWDQLTEREKNQYYYLLNTQGQRAAYQFLDDMKLELNRRTQASRDLVLQGQMADAGTLERIMLNAASVPANLIGDAMSGMNFAVYGAKELAEQISEGVSGRELFQNEFNPYASVTNTARYAQGIRSAQADIWDRRFSRLQEHEYQDANGDTRTRYSLEARKVPVLGLSAGGIYQAIMSRADSMAGEALNKAFGGLPLYGILMGSGAAASEAEKLWNDGATDFQIVAGSVLAGVAEGVFEELSLDKIIEMRADTHRFRQWLMNQVKGGFIEGSEEWNTQIADTMIDMINRGDMSAVRQARDRYIQQGMSEQEATAQALVDVTKEAWEAFSGGFISGALGGAQSVVNYTQTQQQNRQAGHADIAAGRDAALYQLARETAAGGHTGEAGIGLRLNARLAENAVNNALENPENKGARRRADQRVGNLSTQVRDAQLNQDRNDMIQYLRGRGKSRLQARNIVDAVTEYVKGSEYMNQEAREEMRKELDQRFNKDGSVDALLSMISDEEGSVKTREMFHRMARQGLRDTEEKGVVDFVTGEQRMTREEAKMLLNPENNATKIIDKVRKGEDIKVNADSEITINNKTDQEINLENAKFTDVNVKKGTATLDVDGEKIALSDITFGTEREAVLYNMPVQLGITNTNTINQLVQMLRNKDAKMENLALAIDEAYRNGYYNQTDASMIREKGSVLTDAEYNTIFRMARHAASKQIEFEQQEVARRIADELEKRTYREVRSSLSNKGKVVLDESVSKEFQDYIDGKFEGELTEERRDLRERQAASFHAAEMLSSLAPGLTVHMVESVDGKWNYKGKEISANGVFDPETHRDIYIDINSGATYQGIIMDTLAHELTHYIRAWSPTSFKRLSDYVISNLSKSEDFDLNTNVHSRIADAQARGDRMTYDGAVEEIVADAMTGMLRDGTVAQHLQNLQQQDQKLADKIREFFRDILDRFKELIGAYEGQKLERSEARALEQMEGVHDELQKMFAEALYEANAMQNVDSIDQLEIGDRNISEDFEGAYDQYGQRLFQYRAIVTDKEIYRQMLEEHGGLSSAEIDELFGTIDEAVDLIKNNLEALDYAWERDIDDRSETPVKKNSDPLYTISIDFSTLCRKRLLQQVVQMHLQNALDRSITKDESIAIRDALMRVQAEGRQIEVACALCYVESARMRSYDQIKKFLEDPGKVIEDYFKNRNKSGKEATKAAEMQARQQLADENPNGVTNSKGEQVNFLTDPLKKMPGKFKKVIQAAKKAALAETRITDEQRAFVEEARKMTVADFTSPEGLSNLAKNHREIFSAYTAFVAAAAKAKGISGDTWWRAGDSTRGDVTISNSLLERMNAENGFRSQSWSDFQVIHLLDYIAETIEMSTRDAKEQVYTKVQDFVDLMGETGAMINMSLIPTADAYNGTLLYDSVEGFDYEAALRYREKFPATAGTICIGVEDEQIRALLADTTIDYVIPYHDSGMSKDVRKKMHIPQWVSYQNFQNEKNVNNRQDAARFARARGVTLLSESNEKWHVAPEFSEWFDLQEARQIAEMENANPSDLEAANRIGVMYGAYKAMQQMAGRYLDLCAQRGVRPKFSTGTDFTVEENYWKLLIDRKMVNNATGEIIEQQAIKPKFNRNTIMRILNDELERYGSVKADQEEATRRVVEELLPVLSKNTDGSMTSKQINEAAGYKLQSRETVVQDIADTMQTPVDNIVTTNVLSSVDQQAAEDYANAEVDQKLVKLIEDYRNGITFERYELGTASKALVDYVKQTLGYDISGFKVILVGKEMTHIENRHGIHGKADHSMANANNFGKMNFALETPDMVELGEPNGGYTEFRNGKSRPANTVVVSRSIGSSNYYVIQAVPNTKAHEVYIISAFIGGKSFIDEKAKINEDRFPSDALNAPGATSENETLSSLESVSQDTTTSQEGKEKKQSRTVTQLDEDYMAAVKRGDTDITARRTAQRMVDDAAKEWGAVTDERGRPLKLFHGTPHFGFTVFDSNGPIFTTPDQGSAAGYGGGRGYADPRRINEVYTQDDGTDDTLIKNVKNVLHQNARAITDDDISSVKARFTGAADEMNDRVIDAWEYGEGFPEIPTDIDNGIAWMLTLPGEVMENLDDILSGGEYADSLRDTVNHFNRYREDVRNWFVDHRSEIIAAGNEDLYRLITGFDLTDFAIDVEYSLLRAADRENYLIGENGGFAGKDALREQVERLRTVGSYSLYGNLGNNPLYVDANGAFWTNIDVPALSDVSLSTNAIVSEAQKAGYTSVVIRNVMDPAMNDYSPNRKMDEYIFFSSDQVKSADPVTYDDAGNPIPLSERFNSENPDIRFQQRSVQEIQAEYEEALNAENEDWQKQLVGEAAYNAGYTTGAYHGSPFTDIDSFNTRSEDDGKQKKQLLFGTHFTRNRSYADIYAKKAKNSAGTSRMTTRFGRVYDVYLDLGKSLDLITARNYTPDTDIYQLYEDMPDRIRRRIKPRTFTDYDTQMGLGSGSYINIGDIERALQMMSPKEATDFLVSHGYNSVLYNADYSIGMANNSLTRDPSIIMLDPERIKSGDPITYDDNGDVIPLTERFNRESTRIRYQERFVGETNQELLENADANAAQTPDERKALLSYQNYIEKQHSVRDRLNALNARIASGEGDVAEMQKTAHDLEKQIRKYGTKLHELETSTPLRGLIERERVNAAERARERGQRALERYRENMTKKIEDIKAHNREQRAKGVDSRRRTELRGQIRRRVNDIEHILNHGTKDRNVKEGMRPAMEKAVNTARLLFSDLNNRDIARRNVAVLQTDTERSLYEEYRKYVDALDVYKARPNADSDPQLQRMIRAAESRISNLGEKLSEVFDRTRKSIYETAVDSALVELSDGYKDLANAPEAYIRNAYDENVVKKIEELRTNLEGATLMRMTQEQLEAMKDVYTMVATTIRNANELFADNLRATVTENGTQVMEEIRETNRNKKLRGVESRLGRSVRTYMWNNLKPIYAMERIGSKSLTALFKNIRRAEGVWAVDVNEAKDFLLDTEKKHNFNRWDLNQKKTFTADTGETFQMTLAQAMSIYAYTRRGDAAVNHLINGGFTFDNNAEQNTQKIGPFKRTGYVTDKQAYRIGLDTIEDISNMLTDEQKAWVDEMQDYLSDTMGEKGNEVSMAMYGVRLYNEEHYFPIRTDSTYRDVNANETAGEVKIKNAGFSNSLTPNASNPIILSDFLDIWSDHVNDMSMYHAFVLPLEDFQKVYNYRTSNANESGAQSVRSTLDTYYNGQASTYITQMLRDLNNGTRSDPRESAYKRLLSNFKKAATFVSASVVVQQPTSIFRAMAYIDPKYFVGTDTQLLRNGRLWEELKKYAPVAIIKEMGHFDTDMGVSTQEWMQSQDPKLFSRDGLKALLTDTNYRDSMLGKAPEMADQITWVAMWQACKREARDQNKNLTEEQILQKAGERFEDIVMYTQVYDSVLSRSSNMRSKSMFMSMATSFMAEPTTWANMVEHSIREMTRGNAKAGIRELGAVAVSSIAVAMMSSLVYAMRDDDDDETYTEKFMASFLGELLDELNPLTHLPIVQDVWNIMSGWSVERADMTLVENLYKSVDKLVEAWATDTKGMSDEELQEHSKKLSDAYWSMASTISAFVGVPMQNVRKDVMGLIHTIENAGSGMTTTKESVLDAMGAEFRKSIPFLARFMPEKKRQQKLYDAIMSGDDEYAQRLGGQYANEIAFHAALRKALRENDDRIEAGARARYEGNIAEYIRIVNEIKAEGNFSQDDIVASMNTLINQWTNEAKESDGNGAPAAVSMFKNSDLFDALFSGDETSADVISEYLVEMKVADGKTEEEAVKNLNSAITSEIRRRYKEGELTREEYKDWMLQYSTKSEKELDKELLKEDYLSETGFEWSDHEEAYLSGQVTTQDTISWIMRIEGKNKEDAQKILRRVDFRAADPDTTLQTYQIDQYYSTIQSTGISIPVWTTYCQQSAKCKGADANGDGKTDPGSKKVQVMKVIDSLPISNAQKDELYRLNGWSEKTINEAPWR